MKSSGDLLLATHLVICAKVGDALEIPVASPPFVQVVTYSLKASHEWKFPRPSSESVQRPHGPPAQSRWGFTEAEDACKITGRLQIDHLKSSGDLLLATHLVICAKVGDAMELGMT